MRELGAPLELTIVQADIHALIRNNLADLRHEQAAIYAALIRRLHAAGAECAAITSLGGHFCFDETAQVSALPLVSGIAPLDEYFAAAGDRRVGLLGLAFDGRDAGYRVIDALDVHVALLADIAAGRKMLPAAPRG